APFRFPDTEGLFFAIVRRCQMIDAGEQRAKLLAVVDDAADGNSAKADAMVAALAAKQPDPRSVAANVMIGKRDLECGVDCLGAGIAEENVVEIARGKRRDPARQLEGLGVPELESRRVVERRRLALDRYDYRLSIVPGIGAPEPGRAVDELAPVVRVVM